jgi:integrase
LTIPLKGVQKDKEPPGRLRYLSRQEEEDELLEGCRGRFKALVLVALHTGMRRGELLRLTWEDVDFDQGFIHITQTKNGERRTLPINETVWSPLTTLRVRQDIPWVFHDEEGRQYGYIRNIFLWACKRAKIRDFRFHDLRHTFASRLVMNGYPLATVSQLLGHKSIYMTMRYAHLSPEHRMGPVRSLDKNMTISGFREDLQGQRQPFERTNPCVSV